MTDFERIILYMLAVDYVVRFIFSPLTQAFWKGLTGK
jgi:hypothetical protein